MSCYSAIVNVYRLKERNSTDAKLNKQQKYAVHVCYRLSFAVSGTLIGQIFVSFSHFNIPVLMRVCVFGKFNVQIKKKNLC